MSIHLDNLMKCLESGFTYLPTTAKLTFIPYIIGAVLGLMIALIRVYRIPFFSQLLAIFITIYRGIPIMVAFLLFYLLYVLKFDQMAEFLHLSARISNTDKIIVAYFTLSIFAATSISETFRGALTGISKEQYEAGYSVGLTEKQTLQRIIFPQMFLIAISGLINNIVGSIKATSLVLVIGITEVTAGSIIPCGITYSFTEGYLAAAIIYWLFSFIVESFAKMMEVKLKKYRRNAA